MFIEKGSLSYQNLICHKCIIFYIFSVSMRFCMVDWCHTNEKSSRTFIRGLYVHRKYDHLKEKLVPSTRVLKRVHTSFNNIIYFY